MVPLTGQEIRRKFKAFFAERGHLVFESASLVPHDDPTLLWINAGMAPLKPYFDGREIPEKPRIVNAQKCIRTNDIENVGHTARHQTFFEMMGNFSFGDYFKQEAITWAWDFSTNHLGFEPDRISVTIHVDDDEAFDIWHNQVGVPEEHIYRFDEDNFWEIGEGPCGPCSELFYDRGEACGCGQPTCGPDCDCDRFLEFWNLVFTQYNKGADGEYTPLPKKNIDTGMGLERVAMLVQGVGNNFETDLLRPIINATSNLCGHAFGQDATKDVHFKIIADHVRTVAFAIGDGVLPGNEGRHYIIRRLLRRAVRSGRKLGLNQPFLHQLTKVVAGIMGDDYPAVREQLSFIEKVVRTEEERFHETLEEGEQLLLSRLDAAKATGTRVLAGQDAFQLYDTFGFPIDLTEEICREHGFEVDRDGFTAALNAQRDRARSARQVAEGMNTDRTALENYTEESRFVGYGTLDTGAVVTAIVINGNLVDAAQPGEEAGILLDVTPFYAESGGQVADRGWLEWPEGSAEVLDVQKAPHGQNVQTVEVTAGRLQVGQTVRACVDESLRRDTIKNHTATHLLHKALREVLGTHVAQAGSLVTPERLRFDFSHIGAMSEEELTEVERRVNHQIWLDHAVKIEEMDIDDAKALGAMALFGEKYGRRVRVVEAGDYSIELCGGCHVAQTGIIGEFRILSETGIGSGVRRIEAVTGRHAYAYAKGQDGLIGQLSDVLKTSPQELLQRVEKTLQQVADQGRQIESLSAQLNQGRAAELERLVQDVNGIPVVAAQVNGQSMDGLLQLADQLKAKLQTYVIVLGTATDKVQLVAAVSKDLQSQGLHAGNLVKSVAGMVGGGGGGRPDMAQAGGKHPEKLPEAILKVAEIVGQAAGISHK
jgi:alanyl-tRNA synthetase